jgi:DNA-binding LytR/AlgR family response regulator
MLSIALFLLPKINQNPTLMPIDYSRQIGKKIATRGHKKRFIDVECIMYIQCEDHLCTLFLNNGSKIHDIKTLRKFEKELLDMGFFRIRNNIIINGNHITEVDTRMEKRTVKIKEIVFIVAKSRLKSFKGGLS